jgi:hypothetical protein
MKINSIFKHATVLVASLIVSSVLNAQTVKLPVFHQDGESMTNPNASRDLQIASDYVYALFGGDLDKVKSLAADSFAIYGPGADHKEDLQTTITTWKENYKTQSDREVGYFHAQTWRNTGPLAGDWVSVWSEYKFKVNGTQITIPFNLAMNISDGGKIVWGVTSFDLLSVWEKLGYKLVPPPAKKGK